MAKWVPKTNRPRNNLRHGLSKTKIWVTWINIKRRCLNPTEKEKKYYGKKTLLDPRWLKFENFFEDMGQPPTQEHSIDRIDNNLGYCKKNCRWADVFQQNQNRRCVIRYKTKTLKEWAEIIGVGIGALYRRYYFKGWSLKRTCETPYKNKTNTKHRGVQKRQYKNSIYWGAILKGKWIGTFKSEREAAIAYNKASKELFGQYGWQNQI